MNVISRENILAALEACYQNKTHAARRFGISARTLDRWLNPAPIELPYPGQKTIRVPLSFSMREKLDFLSMPEPMSGCVLWIAGLDAYGYGHFHWRGDEFKAHRVNWELEKGPIPIGLYVLHKCDVRSCININHLFLGTHDDNMADMSAKGRSAKPIGELAHAAKLSAEDIVSIRIDLRPYWEIGLQYKIDPSTVSRIKSGDAWKHMLGAPGPERSEEWRAKIAASMRRSWARRRTLMMEH